MQLEVVDFASDRVIYNAKDATREELDETVALVEAKGGKMVGSVADVIAVVRVDPTQASMI